MKLKNKLWFNIFIRIAVIFAVFVVILSVSNIGLLSVFFEVKEKTALKNQLAVIENTNLNDNAALIKTISDINEKYNFDVEIYRSDGTIIYTTHGGQMLDFFEQHNDSFNMSHEALIPEREETLSDGITFQIATRPFDSETFLLCKKRLQGDIFAEVRVPRQLISKSASVANEFIIIISFCCLLVSVVWVLIFARRFSSPISKMNSITKAMASLDFSEKLTIEGEDEIAQLAVSVNTLSSSLSAALEDLKEKNRKLEADIDAERRLDGMRREFIANTSHELKTPIAVIRGYAEGLKLGINPEKRDDYCDIIIDESDRMNRLVLSILELSRYESGQIPLKFQCFDIAPLSESLCGRILKGKNITLQNNIKNGTLVFADEIQIEQVLKSLLENAVAHTGDSGEIKLFSEQEKDKIRISVFNSGKPIEEEKMCHIWQSFYRGDSSHKRDNTRFGLGLSIVAAIMKLHNNSCGVYNTENGVCFWFELDKHR